MQPQNKLIIAECLSDKFQQYRETRMEQCDIQSCVILKKYSQNYNQQNTQNGTKRYLISLSTKPLKLGNQKAKITHKISTIISNLPLIQIQCVEYQNIKKQQFTICSSQEINQQIKKYAIVNFAYQFVSGIHYEISSFQLSHKLKHQSLKVIMSEVCKQWKRVWDDYDNTYNKVSKQKAIKGTNKQSKSKQSINQSFCDILPILQLEVQPIIVPSCISHNRISEIHQQYQQTAIILNMDELSCKSSQQPVSQTNDKLQQQVCQRILELLNKNIMNNQSDANRGDKNQININSIPYQLNNHRFAPAKIFNPHVFAKPVYREKYQLFLVKGCYQFYHYGDQKFNDNGWGCAYRAFQTLYSWLHTHGFTKPLSTMISITEIQEKIDSIDRSRRLKGTSQWIGATQVSWLVSRLTKPQINYGKQILQKCEQLKNHFLGTGSPIMYGGGEYAYSIVGMYYNWKLGQCQFLILDPHYTGEDEYSRIMQKKGLAWRRPEQMFKKGIFYNFCLPIIK